MSDENLAKVASDPEEMLRADTQELCREALTLGATEAVAIDAPSISMDPRVRMKCQIPLCASYGVNLMCPPNVMSPAAFAEVLSRYSRAILIRLEIPFSEGQQDAIERAESLSQLRKSGKLRPSMVEGAHTLSRIIGRLESQCYNLGYHFATGLGAGSCRLCDECVSQTSGLPCKHPFEARPSMEAVGIDVFATARNAGIPLSRSNGEKVSWVGLLLVS